MTTSAATLGPYEVIRPLGTGGMGEVYLAHDAKLGRDIAVKVLPEHLAKDRELLARLRQEARLASGLNHPNIITIYEIGEAEQSIYVAMEFIDGRTLREVMTDGVVPVRKALQLGSQIAAGLAAAHQRGLVHRDLKPENIMVTTDGRVKILDFGLAKSIIPSDDRGESAHSLMSDPGTIVGTYGYMSPEQARGREVDYRSDQFALGSILYEMLSGQRPFDGFTGIETLFAIARDEPASLSTIAPHVPPPLRWIVERCMAKDPEDRYVSTRDLSRDLGDLGNHLSEAGINAPVIPDDQKQQPLPTRKPLVAGLIVAILAIAGLGTALAMKKAPPPTISSIRYLTYSGRDFSPAASPDGKMIAFSSDRDGQLRIWLKQTQEGSEVALTAGNDDFPRFSPDGSSIVYSHVEPGGGPGQRGALYRVAVVGGEPRKLVENATTGDWSPDGTKLAFTRPLNVNENGFRGSLWLASADGSEARQIREFPGVGVGHPRWSPDGKKIALVGTEGRSPQLTFIVDVASGEVKRLSAPATGGEVSTVVWGRNGRTIYYLRGDSVEAVVGSTARLIRHDVESDEQTPIAWSPNNALIMDVVAQGKLVFDARSPRDNLREIDLATTTERWVTRGNSSDRQPVYSPDGKTVVFSSNRSGNLDLWSINTGTGAVRRITEDRAEDWDPAFTADGRHIIWSSGRSGNLEIWIANVDGTGARQLSKDGFDAENPAATPDGQWIVYNSFHPEKNGIWKIRQDGSSAVHLVKDRTALPEVSPDGRYVSYIANARGAQTAIRVVRLEDGKDMGLAIPFAGTRRTNAILGRARWMPDGKAIAFLSQDAEGVNGIFIQDFVPGVDTAATRRKLSAFDTERATESFGVSRDGGKLMIAGWEQLFSLMISDGLPEITPARRNG